ncbi:peptidoglycan DD-metalloendopeptidase family protein [Streptomyces sp. NPDC005925]|uniref:M23 family metallopeptidase n=1 Tax=Streptomyces sp. NPDC005925 TaxID=3157172 RepID=UPI00340DDC79
MAVNGRHRRYQPNRINRASLTVTAGGAGIALPLIGTGVAAQAADMDTVDTVAAAGPARGDDAPDVHPVGDGEQRDTPSGVDVRPQTTPQSRAGRTEMYTVVSGDTLSGIAEERKAEGGWQGLYAANRGTVGADPDLILPGQRLSVRAGATDAPAKRTTGPRSSSKSKPKSAPRPEPSAQDRDEDGAKDTRQASRTDTREAAPRDSHRKTAPERPDRKAETGQSGHSVVAPVHASLGTPYRQAGSSWSKGYHTGVDFPVPTGTSVKAVAAGRVVSAGWGGSYGYQVVVRHDDGRYSQYAHLSAISVRAGQTVGAGQRIARSGSTGNSSGPHLHFEVRTGPGFGSDIDPLAYLRAGGVRI